MNRGQKILTLVAVMVVAMIGIKLWMEYPLVEMGGYGVAVLFVGLIWGGLTVAMK